MKRVCLWVCTATAVSMLAVVWSARPAEAQLQYFNQNSANSFYHSGICTTGDGVVWDSQFAALANVALATPGKYKEIAFDFNECFGGGMIDEIRPLFNNASYTSAARWDQFSWACNGFARATQPGVESSYSRPWAFDQANVANLTVLQAASFAVNNDLRGPVAGYPYLANPQYTSTGAIGNSISLHRSNPANPTNAYKAVLFGGSTDDPINALTTARMYNALLIRGYAAGDIYVAFSGGAGNASLTPVFGVPVNSNSTGLGMASAFNWLNTNSTPNTQVFYWNSWGHGTAAFDVLGAWLAAGQTVQQKQAMNFVLSQLFIQQARQVFAFLNGGGLGGGPSGGPHGGGGDPRGPGGPSDPLEDPYLQVETEGLVQGLTANLNGDTLSLVGSPIDVNGDGSKFEYDFSLSGQDLNNLSTSADSVTLDWTQGSAPTFDYITVNDGNDPGLIFPTADTPEPGIIALAGAACLALTGLYRRRMRISSQHRR
jgi:hypothetical protein